MALSPDEAENLTDREIQKISTLEEKINVFLKKTFSSLNPEPRYELGGTISDEERRMIAELQRRYACKGWNVLLDHDYYTDHTIRRTYLQFSKQNAAARRTRKACS